MISFNGIKALFLKELIQMRRDRITFAMMIMMPIAQLIMFGYAINSDPRGLPLGLHIQEESIFSRNIVSALDNSSYFSVKENFSNVKKADNALKRGEISFLLTINPGFEKSLLRGESPQILIEADATDPGAVGGSLNAIPTLVTQSLSNDFGRYFPNLLPPAIGPINVVIHRNYNPEGLTSYNIVPGLIGTILAMTMIMMTSMALTRETERGTMENLLSMPLSSTDIMIGKITPYILVGLVQFLVIIFVGSLLFSIPFSGSFILTLAIVLLYITANLIVGYVFSTLAKTQLQAMQFTFFFFLPSILLSGFMFPFYGMPKWAQYLGEFFPITHFLRIIRGILLKGSDMEIIYKEVFALLLFIFCAGSLAVKRFRKTLD